MVQRRVGGRTWAQRVRSLDLGTSSQEYARAGGSHWRAMVIFERLAHVAHEERQNSVARLWGESGQFVEIRMKGVMAILALGATKGVCGRPWHMLGSLGT